MVAARARAASNLRRLRREKAELRATLHLYEEAVRQLALETTRSAHAGAVNALLTHRPGRASAKTAAPSASPADPHT